MLVNCNSCQKKFTVPNSAITNAGRLLQCGSCGNKWKQYPIKEESVKEFKNIISAKKKDPINPGKIKNTIKKKKRKISLYSDEYLKKKHGLSINDTLNIRNKKQDINEKKTINFGFYNYLIIIGISVTAFFGILNLSKDIIITNYPFMEFHINYLYEFIDIIKITLSQYIS